MGSVTINGSTSGSVTIAAPAVAGSNTLTLPAATGTVITTGSSAALPVSAINATGSPSASTYLRGDGAWASVSTSGRLIRAPQFLTSGTSYTTPAGCNYILIEIVGGGGGGGASTGTQASGGGGNSIFATKYAAVTPSTAYTYAIGGAGNGASSGTTNNGTAGGTTSITIGATTYSVSGGGGGGGGGSAGAAGTSGTATNMDFSTAGIAASRAGGSCLTPFTVNAGGAQVSAANNGISATSFGAGGSGGANGGGGSGYQGCMRIWEYT